MQSVNLGAMVWRLAARPLASGDPVGELAPEAKEELGDPVGVLAPKAQDPESIVEEGWGDPVGQLAPQGHGLAAAGASQGAPGTHHRRGVLHGLRRDRAGRTWCQVRAGGLGARRGLASFSPRLGRSDSRLTSAGSGFDRAAATLLQPPGTPCCSSSCGPDPAPTSVAGVVARSAPQPTAGYKSTR